MKKTEYMFQFFNHILMLTTLFNYIQLYSTIEFKDVISVIIDFLFLDHLDPFLNLCPG